MRSAHHLDLPPDVVARLFRVVRGEKSERRHVRRATIVLLAHQQWPNERIAMHLRVDRKTVRLWRRRFAEDPRVETLLDRPRSGRPAKVAPETRAKLISLACDRVGDKVPFRALWTRASLADALEKETGVRLSVSEVGRILRRQDLRPHHVRTWLNSQDPDFEAKICRVCETYLSPPAGATVLCIDEKRLFVREHLHRHLPPGGRGRTVRQETDYKRHGVQVLLAAFDIATGHVHAEVRDHRKAVDLVEFMEHVASVVPGPVIVVWDNLNIHHEGKTARWSAFNARHGGRFSFVYTPKHASWVNQVELWFSILERRLLRHGSFASKRSQAESILGFVGHWNEVEGHPFRWRFRGEPRRTLPEAA